MGSPLRRMILKHGAKILLSLALLIVVLAFAAAGLSFRRHLMSARQPATPTPSTAPVRIDLAPSNAVVRVDGQIQDVRQELRLPLGSHTISASLDGYDPVDVRFDVKLTDNPPIQLRLTPKALSVRLFLRLSGADVLFDGKKVDPSSDDWFVVPNVNEGPHTVEVRYPYAPVSAKVNLVASAGGVSSIQGPLDAKGGLVLAVSYAPGVKSQLLTSSGPAYVTVAGNRLGPIDRTHPVETQLTPGESPILLEEGGRKDAPYPLTIGAGPFLALFLRADVGQISVDVQPQDATVRVERQGREIRGFQRRRWAFPNLEPGEYLVRIQKEGFTPQEKKLILGKGAHILEKVALVEQLKKATLEITGIPAGMEGSVLVDNKPVGNLAPEFRFNNLEPGQHAVKLAVRNHESDTLTGSFTAGATVQFSLASFKVRKRYGKLDLRGVEPAAQVTLTLIDEKSGRRETKRLADLSPREVPLEFDVEYSARFEAPGFKPTTKKVFVRDLPNESEFHLGRFTLEEIPKPATPPPPPVRKAEALPGWDNPSVWAPDRDGWRLYKGGAPAQLEAAAGTITFEIKFRGSAKWQVNFVDSNNHIAVELKKDRLERRRTNAGKKEREQSTDIAGPNQEVRRVRITLRGDVVEHAIFDNGKWTVVDQLEGNTLGKGRFVLAVNNKMSLRNFEYLPTPR